MDDQDQFQTLAIVEMTGRLVHYTAGLEGDINVKIAALRSAADVLSQAVSAATLAAMVRRSLSP